MECTEHNFNFYSTNFTRHGRRSEKSTSNSEAPSERLEVFTENLSRGFNAKIFPVHFDTFITEIGPAVLEKLDKMWRYVKPSGVASSPPCTAAPYSGPQVQNITPPEEASYFTNLSALLFFLVFFLCAFVSQTRLAQRAQLKVRPAALKRIVVENLLSGFPLVLTVLTRTEVAFWL